MRPPDAKKGTTTVNNAIENKIIKLLGENGVKSLLCWLGRFLNQDIESSKHRRNNYISSFLRLTIS
jgi:hypothetical protein